MSLALFVVLLFTVSANTDRVYTAAEGTKAPSFQVQAAVSGNTVSLDDFKGHYVIVSFWSSDDAPSRLAAGQYDRFAHSSSAGQVALLSVNLDSNERLYREIARIDGLNAESQYHAQGHQADQLIRRFQMTDGLQSFLVDPEGKIAAVNPSITAIADAIAL